MNKRVKVLLSIGMRFNGIYFKLNGNVHLRHDEVIELSPKAFETRVKYIKMMEGINV